MGISINRQTTVEYEKSGHEHEFEFDAVIHMNNDGIGPYEYWGCRGNDKGEWYIDEIEIEQVYIMRNGKKRKIKKIPEIIEKEISDYVDRHSDDILSGD